MICFLLRVDASPPHTYSDCARQKSGYPYSTLLTLVEKGGKRWLVTPYGEVAGYETLVQSSSEPYRGRRFETVRIVELAAEAPLRC